VNLVLISGKYTAITVGILILVVLNSGCVSINGSAEPLNLNDNSSNLTEVNMTDNVYYGNGVSFNYSGTWFLNPYSADGSNMVEVSYDPYISINLLDFGFQLSPSINSPRVQIQIIDNEEFSKYSGMSDNSNYSESKDLIAGFSNYETMPGNSLIENSSFSNYTGISTSNNLSEKEIIDIMRKSTDSIGTKVSNVTITIDDKTAYRDVFILNSLWPPVIDQRFEHIVFVKNGKTYIMLLQVPNKDYSKEKQNFDIIINSFRVQ
jgi:hypothetical protein